MFWQITAYPRCDYHIFLSHCAADRKRLVHPIYDELKRMKIIPWLDREDYYYGRDSRTALRDGLLRSRHAVFFVTPGMMAYTRGWCTMELAYSDLLQANFMYSGGPLLNFALPLFFLDQANARISKSVWGLLRDRGIFHKMSDGNPVKWAVKQIAKFLHSEQRLAVDMAKVLVRGKPFYNSLAGRPGLARRITHFDPSEIP